MRGKCNETVGWEEAKGKNFMLVKQLKIHSITELVKNSENDCTKNLRLPFKEPRRMGILSVQEKHVPSEICIEI